MGVKLNDADNITGLPNQMSNDWVRYVADKLIESGNNTGNVSKIAVGNMIKNNPNLIERVVTTVNKKTGDINILKLGIFN